MTHLNSTNHKDNHIAAVIINKRNIFFRKMIPPETWQNLHDLLSSGIALLPAIKILCEQQKAYLMRIFWRHTYRSVANGLALHNIISKFKKIADPLTISCLHAGFESGRLTQAIDLITKNLRYKQTLHKKITSLLIYPAFVLIVAAIIIVFFTKTLLPNFLTLFNSSGQQLPYITNLLLSTTNAIQQHLTGILASTCLLYLFYRIIATKSAHAAKIIYTLKYKIALFRIHYEYSLCSNLSLCLDSGVTLLTALTNFQHSHRNIYLQHQIATIGRKIISGHSLHTSMQQSGIFSKQLLTVIAISEQSGSLQAACARLTQQLQRQLDDAISRLSKILSPVIMLILAAVVGTIVAAIYMPLFKMGQNL